jgi:hypothetical protein
MLTSTLPHCFCSLPCLAGRLYTLTCGSSERRWNKMGDRLKGTIASFNLLF